MPDGSIPHHVWVTIPSQFRTANSGGFKGAPYWSYIFSISRLSHFPYERHIKECWGYCAKLRRGWYIIFPLQSFWIRHWPPTILWQIYTFTIHLYPPYNKNGGLVFPKESGGSSVRGHGPPQTPQPNFQGDTTRRPILHPPYGYALDHQETRGILLRRWFILDSVPKLRNKLSSTVPIKEKIYSIQMSWIFRNGISHIPLNTIPWLGLFRNPPTK